MLYGFLQDLFDSFDAGDAVGVGRPLRLLGHLPDEGGVVDGDPVDRGSDDELSGEGDPGEVAQQVGENDVVGGHGHRCGEVGVEVPASCHPGLGVVDALLV